MTIQLNYHIYKEGGNDQKEGIKKYSSKNPILELPEKFGKQI